MRSSSTGISPLFPLLGAFLWMVLVSSCVVRPVNWTGSVDAVFKYQSKQKSTVVHKIRPDSYSEKAGLKTNDILLAVDEHDVSNSSFEMVRASLRGPAGTFAVLTVKRGDRILDIQIERKPVRSESSKSGRSDTGKSRK